MDRVESMADQLGAPIPAHQAEKLVVLANLVARWGARMNLTGHVSPEAILEHLVLDALALRAQIRQLVPAVNGQLIVDLGSGAGFPGLPLAIVEPESQIQLVEARRRRHHFQRTARRELELSNVEPRLGRIEDLKPTQADLVVAQALAKIDQVVGWAVAWTRSGGCLIVPGSEHPPVPASHPAIVASGTCRYETPAGRARSLWWGRVEGPMPSVT